MKTLQEQYNLIKEGILKAFSVGFRVKEADYDVNTDIFVIKDVELYEVSVVSVPANQDSLFEVSKCFNNPAEYAEFKKLADAISPNNIFQWKGCHTCGQQMMLFVFNNIDKLKTKKNEKKTIATVTDNNNVI